MWHSSGLGLGVLLLVAAGVASVGAQAAPIPQSEGWVLIVSRCVICHGLEVATQQRLGPRGWAENVDRMIGYGMPIQPGEREVILAYLLRHFRDPEGQ